MNKHLHPIVHRLIITGLALVMLLSVPINTASALTYKAIQDAKFSKAWYLRNDKATACNTSSSSTTLVGSKDADKVFNFLTASGRLKPFQAAGVMGNMTAESGIQPQRLEGTKSGTITPAEKVTSGGWGLVQWTPASKFIKTNNPISKANDLAVQLNFLWNQLEGTGPEAEKQAGDDIKATTNIEDATTAFQGNKKVGGKYYGFERPDDQAKTLPDRIASAKNILREQGGGGGGGGGGGSCGSPSNSTGAVADAIKLAMDYSWPAYHKVPYITMKPSYAAAVTAAKANGEYIGGIKYPGVDCGGFVTRVMRNSGADPNYNWGPKNPKQGPTSAQQAYMSSSPKYKKLGTQTSTAGLQPGDIAINDTHTYMYVGKQTGFGGNSASASLDGRAPMASAAYFSNFQWYRLIQ